MESILFKTKRQTRKGERIVSVLMSIVLAFMVVVPGLFDMPLAYGAAIEKGNIAVKNVIEGEEFKAVRFITSEIHGGDIVHKFSEGIAFDSNDKDGGIEKFAALRGQKELTEGIAVIEKQFSDSQQEFRAVADENGIARFENLPLGQYLITAVSPKPTRMYLYMLGNVTPTFNQQENMWGMDNPIELFAKYKDITIPKEETPILNISKQATPTNFDDTKTVINYTVKVNFDKAKKIQFLHVDDDIDAVGIKQKYALNEDVKISYDGAQMPISTARVTYKYVEGRIVGYSVDIPEVDGTKTVVITYTASAKELTEKCDIINVASSYAAGVETDEAKAMVSYNPTFIDANTTPTDRLGLADESIDDNATPLDVIRNVIAQTGDKILFIGGLVSGALIALLFFFVWRRKKQ